MKERETMENGNQNHRELEIIKNIESLGGYYGPTSNLSLEDQLLACETVSESKPTDPNSPDAKWMRSDPVLNGSDNGTRYLRVNVELSQNYLEAIAELKLCTYKSPPITISVILERLYGISAKKDHWLWVAQHYNPRQIIWVLSQMKKKTDTGAETIRIPGAYFTESLKFRNKRKIFRKK